MQTNLSNQTNKGNQQELKRKQNLKRQKRDEKNAAVTRDEFMQALSEQHRMPIFHAGQIISSLYQAKRIRYLGSTFIQMNEEESK
ncbi:hypothetical protein ACT4YP_13490 [Acinetobacter baumannii]